MIQIEVQVPRAAVDAFVAALDALVHAVTAFEAAPDSDAWRVTAFAAVPPPPDAIAAALAGAAARAGIAEPEPRVAPVAERDWVAESRRHARPVRAGRFFVYPGHYDGPLPAGATALRIDAGLAFGTGDHATTRGCLLMLDALDRRSRVRRGRGRVLDLGCGSGVLALAVAKRWKRPVLALDVDPIAVDVARANAAANRVAPWVRVARSDGFRHRMARRRGSHRLVLANVLARPLVRLAGPCARALAPGGTVVLAGLLASQVNWVAGAYRARGLRPLARARDGDWVALALRRPFRAGAA